MADAGVKVASGLKLIGDRKMALQSPLINLAPLTQAFHPSFLQTLTAGPDSGTFKDSHYIITPLTGGRVALWPLPRNSL